MRSEIKNMTRKQTLGIQTEANAKSRSKRVSQPAVKLLSSRNCFWKKPMQKIAARIWLRLTKRVYIEWVEGVKKTRNKICPFRKNGRKACESKERALCLKRVIRSSKVRWLENGTVFLWKKNKRKKWFSPISWH
jgi:hypothetical protein